MENSGRELNWGAMGAAMAASVCSGEYEDLEEAVKNMSSIQRRFEPNKTNEEIYRKKYLHYKELITKLSK